ncbi:YfdQ family protein [Chitiniphilus purpureus]|uniref:YfdQ family protein n=1 Tax=Chitiniphilus purpureus TaxID=2981137 RepID=A0ABY6DHL6_9NEIS|nr:YfdQ family protein [Chitiniphilus sp. CD1]UXY13837.1 YfdQ family protein [Chitiniphilus sp. CD1]
MPQAQHAQPETIELAAGGVRAAYPHDLKALLEDVALKPSATTVDATTLQKQQIPVLYVPHNHKAELLPDLEKHLPQPLRKKAHVILNDATSFIWYVKEHGSLASCRIYLQADYPKGKVDFLGVINDHTADEAHWRDHTASFSPAKSIEWQRWLEKNRTAMSQLEFATWIEDNMQDIATVTGMPTAAQMLELALTFEAVSDKKFKSATRIQSGGIDLEYVDREDDATRQRMKMFERFTIGIPAFAAPITEANKPGQDTGEPPARVAYRIDARLKYRIRDGVLQLWYELVRPDKVLEAASQDIVQKIQHEAGFPLLAGSPNLPA